GQFPGSNRTLFLLLKLGIGGARGVGLDRLGNREFLLGEPAVGIPSIESGPGHGGVDSQKRVKRSHLPVGAESQAHAMVEECAEGVGAAGSIVTDVRLGKAAVLHGPEGEEIYLRLVRYADLHI